MNIVGENFPKEIVDQINLRQTKLGSSHRDNELLSWMNSKTDLRLKKKSSEKSRKWNTLTS